MPDTARTCPIFAGKWKMRNAMLVTGSAMSPLALYLDQKSALLRVGQEQTQELYSNVTVTTVERSGHWTSS